MDPFVITAALLPTIALTVAAWLFGPPLWRSLRRSRATSRPFPIAWREVLQRRMPLYRRLPPPLQLQLRKHVQVLIAEKPFIGCGGLVVDDEVRVLIAAQASLLLLNRDAGGFPRLRQILVYPDAFVVDRALTDGSGIVRDARRVLAGESWQQGQLVLSWQDVVEGAADADDGRNVVIHEFAHQLDQETGHANGAPYLGARERYRDWSAVLGAAYADLRARIDRGDITVIDPYGGEDPAEFFAVVSELFFERPQALADENRSLYLELSRYYRVDPLRWS